MEDRSFGLLQWHPQHSGTGFSAVQAGPAYQNLYYCRVPEECAYRVALRQQRHATPGRWIVVQHPGLRPFLFGSPNKAATKNWTICLSGSVLMERCVKQTGLFWFAKAAGPSQTGSAKNTKVDPQHRGPPPGQRKKEERGWRNQCAPHCVTEPGNHRWVKHFQAAPMVWPFHKERTA